MLLQFIYSYVLMAFIFLLVVDYTDYILECLIECQLISKCMLICMMHRMTMSQVLHRSQFRAKTSVSLVESLANGHEDCTALLLGWKSRA